MNKLTRRDFLKLSTVFGAGALVPWVKVQLPNGPSYMEEVSQHTIDAVEEELTRILFWVDGSPLRGIYQTHLDLGRTYHRKDEFVPLDPTTTLSCSWAGYPYRLKELQDKIDFLHPINIKVEMAGAQSACQGPAYLTSREVFQPTTHYFLKQGFFGAVLGIADQLLCCHYTFQGTEPWKHVVY